MIGENSLRLAFAPRSLRRRPCRLGRFFSFWGAQDILVEPFQHVEFSHPLVEREAAQAAGIHRSIEPIRRLAAGEIEIAVSLFKPRVRASFRERFIDGLYGEPHVRSA
jgi:hypothetical protein